MDHSEVIQSNGGYVQMPQPEVAAGGNGLSNNTSAATGDASPRVRTPHENEYDTPP